ncbi:MAG: HIT family protein [Acidimicrobiales bacterium]
MSDRLDRMWATWRSDYVADSVRPKHESAECVLCGVLEEGGEQVIHPGEHASVILNAFPYNSGHVMVLPNTHVATLSDLSPAARAELFELLHLAIEAINGAYSPDGVNFGANIGRGAGAGIPDHLHLHALPRWHGDTNFMTTVGGTRVVPESLSDTAAKVRAAFANR